MAVEARFYVHEVSKRPSNNTESGPVGVVRMRASIKGPNDWSEFTPAGMIEMSTLNEKAMAWFDERLGTDVALVFDDIPANE